MFHGLTRLIEGHLRHRDEQAPRNPPAVEDAAGHHHRHRKGHTVQDRAPQIGAQQLAAAEGAGCGGTSACVTVSAAVMGIP